ncbi:hypothetical protein AAG570_013806 [Ranatra chinensis]|uniref:Uncharacterized protein n=1 Tax=Ranatra chinensis TaxID=642074 RepID=A0ABD0YRZ8_9HEMI
MSELQATVEFSIELCKFYNVDLFQRGFYQVRVSLKVSPKLPVKVEASIPTSQPKSMTESYVYICDIIIIILILPGSELAFPACVVNGVGISKTFQILYRNEEVILDDTLLFRVHILVDSHKIEESIERADIGLNIELWFTDQPLVSDQLGSITCVSTRNLQLTFSPMRGLHYHLPVLFDYFHLSAVTITIHASLVALHQPYIKSVDVSFIINFSLFERWFFFCIY